MSQSPSLSQLQQSSAFLRRHLGPDAAEQQAMLAAMGLSSRAELIEQTVPPAIRLNRALDLPPALDEEAALAKLRGYAEQNQVWTSLIGMGYHGTLTPAVIVRNVLDESGLVHRLHAVSAGNRSRPLGGVAELPATDHRPDRAWTWPTPRCSMKPPPPPKPWPWPSAWPRARATCSSSTRTATRKPSPWCRPAPRPLASRW